MWDVLELFAEHLTFEHGMIWEKRIRIQGTGNANTPRGEDAFCR